MERTLCLYEHAVEFNLSESGVFPLRVEDLLDGDVDVKKLLTLGLKYPESDGSPELREHIAQWYGKDAELRKGGWPASAHSRTARRGAAQRAKQ